jgi:hypothetical protein
MKKTILLLIATLISTQTFAATPPPGYCEVKVCNKLSRWSLSPWSHIKDKLGETCSTQILAKEDAVEGKVLESNTRFYQGSFNPTKKSVTKVKEVKKCG